MGQKVSPIIQRIGYTKNWRSIWYAEGRDFAKNVLEDRKIREHIKVRYVQGAVSLVEIQRLAEELHIRISSARPGVIIGRRGADIERLRNEIVKFVKIENMDNLKIDIKEIKNPAAEAQLVAQNVAFQLEKRVAFRRAMKRAVDQALMAGVKGIRIRCSGRLGGAEMARTEGYTEGKVPLQTLRADIDYGFAEAQTVYGTIGVKCWVYKRDVIKDKEIVEE